MRVLVLGGAGQQGSYSIEKMIADDFFDEMILADYDKAKVDAHAKKLNNPKISTIRLDVMDKDALVAEMNKADIVANCTGPYYKLLEPVIDALMASTCKNYIDFCDDIEVFHKVITEENQKIAKERGMRVIIGMGGSPGFNSILAMSGGSLMDEVETINMYAMMDELDGGGTAVWDHMFENFEGILDVYKDGKIQTEQGLSVKEYHDFDPKIFGDLGEIPVYTLGHPEIFTLPKAYPDIKDINIKVSLYPVKFMEMIVDLNHIGMLSNEPIQVGDVKVSPRAVLLQLMENFDKDPNTSGGFFVPGDRPVEEQQVGSTMEVYGKKDGKKAVYSGSYELNMGVNTGYPLAIGARLLAEGKIKPTGFMVPEEAITEPAEFVEEFFASAEKANHPLKKNEYIIYDI